MDTQTETTNTIQYLISLYTIQDKQNASLTTLHTQITQLLLSIEPSYPLLDHLSTLLSNSATSHAYTLKESSTIKELIQKLTIKGT